MKTDSEFRQVQQDIKELKDQFKDGLPSDQLQKQIDDLRGTMASQHDELKSLLLNQRPVQFVPPYPAGQLFPSYIDTSLEESCVSVPEPFPAPQSPDPSGLVDPPLKTYVPSPPSTGIQISTSSSFAPVSNPTVPSSFVSAPSVPSAASQFPGPSSQPCAPVVKGGWIENFFWNFPSVSLEMADLSW